MYWSKWLLLRQRSTSCFQLDISLISRPRCCFQCSRYQNQQFGAHANASLTGHARATALTSYCATVGMYHNGAIVLQHPHLPFDSSQAHANPHRHLLQRPGGDGWQAEGSIDWHAPKPAHDGEHRAAGNWIMCVRKTHTAAACMAARSPSNTHMHSPMLHSWRGRARTRLLSFSDLNWGGHLQT